MAGLWFIKALRTFFNIFSLVLAKDIRLNLY
jgi:hypothetical protein